MQTTKMALALSLRSFCLLIHWLPEGHKRWREPQIEHNSADPICIEIRTWKKKEKRRWKPKTVNCWHDKHDKTKEGPISIKHSVWQETNCAQKAKDSKQMNIPRKLFIQNLSMFFIFSVDIHNSMNYTNRIHNQCNLIQKTVLEFPQSRGDFQIIGDVGQRNRPKCRADRTSCVNCWSASRGWSRNTEKAFRMCCLSHSSLYRVNSMISTVWVLKFWKELHLAMTVCAILKHYPPEAIEPAPTQFPFLFPPQDTMHTIGCPWNADFPWTFLLAGAPNSTQRCSLYQDSREDYFHTPILWRCPDILPLTGAPEPFWDSFIANRYLKLRNPTKRFSRFLSAIQRT
jgi:hypothetical protein